MIETSLENEQKQNGGIKKVLVSLFVLIVLIVIGCLTYVAMMATPKKVFTTAIDKVYKTANESTKESPTTLAGDFSIQTEINSEDENYNKIFAILNNLDLDLNYEIDYNQKIMNMDLTTKYNNKDLLSASMTIKEEEAYIYLNELFDKYIHVPIENFEDIYTSNQFMEDYKVILKEVKNALDKSLKDDYFTSESTTITINEKSQKVTKNILNLTEDNLQEIMEVMTKELNKDAFIESVARISNTEKEEIKESLENPEKITLENGTLTISIYTKGITKEVVGIEIKDNVDTINIVKDTDTKFSYEIISEETTIKGNLEIKTDDKNATLTIFFDTDEINGTVTLNYSYTYNEKVTEKVIDNVIDADALTIEDQQQIYYNLQNNEAILEFIQAISSVGFTDNI